MLGWANSVIVLMMRSIGWQLSGQQRRVALIVFLDLIAAIWGLKQNRRLRGDRLVPRLGFQFSGDVVY